MVGFDDFSFDNSRLNALHLSNAALDGTLVETTILRVQYFGLQLSGPEAGMFAAREPAITLNRRVRTNRALRCLC